jgi:hypothetical protein
MSFLGFHRHHPTVSDTRIHSKLTAKALSAGTHFLILALQGLGKFHGQGLLANSRRPVNQNGLRETILPQSRHKPDPLAFLGDWTF